MASLRFVTRAYPVKTETRRLGKHCEQVRLTASGETVVVADTNRIRRHRHYDPSARSWILRAFARHTDDEP